MSGKYRRPADAEAQIEALLRCASHFEPRVPAPDDLVERALARYPRARPRRPWFFRPMLMPALAGAAAAFGLLVAPGAEPGEGLGEAVPAERRSAVAPAPRTPRRGAVERVIATRRAAPVNEHGGRGGRRARRQQGVVRLARRAVPPVVPQARWEVETVRWQVAGVLTPVLLIETDEDGEQLILTPGIVEIAVPAAACDAGEDAEEAEISPDTALSQDGIQQNSAVRMPDGSAPQDRTGSED
jgi:hypothetical protein